MKLADAASYFDRTPVTDPDSGTLLFYGQIDPYEDSRRDSATSYRRVLSVRPGTLRPAKSVVSALGQVWIMGASEPDGWEVLHREKYVLHHAPMLANVSRLAGFLAGTVASTVRCSAHWSKDAKQLEVSSETPHLYEISLPHSADVSQHDVVWGAGYAYLVLSPRLQASGIFNCQALELEQITPLNATLTARVYNPVTGVYSAPAGLQVKALTVRWQSLFEYGSQMSERYQEGDLSIVLPLGTVISTAMRLALSGVNYQVLAVKDISGAVVVHARVT